MGSYHAQLIEDNLFVVASRNILKTFNLAQVSPIDLWEQ